MQSNNVIELIQRACKTQSEKLDEALKRLLAVPDEEAVHDVRVACRRIRVILNFSEKLYRKRLFKAVQRRVKSLLSSLGDIRDAEVFSKRAHDAVGNSSNGKMTELAKLFDAETQLRRIKSVASIERQRFSTLPRLILAMAAPLAWERKKINKFEKQSAVEFAAEVLSDQLRCVRKYEDLDAKSKSAKLHSLRIEFKKLRYSAEFVESAFAAGQLKPILKFARQMQEILGKIQDTAVAEDMLTPWLRLKPSTDSYDQALRELVDTNREQAKALRQEFEKNWSRRPYDGLVDVFATPAAT
jgi:CHAD domain-containing protein